MKWIALIIIFEIFAIFIKWLRKRGTTNFDEHATTSHTRESGYPELR
jgi:hypothetical protein